MASTRDALDLAIDATAESFLRAPANYSDERALAEDVRSRICSVLPPASVGMVSVEESSGARGSITDHEAYTAQYRNTKEIDRAQCEIGGTDFPFGGFERIDLGVFSDGLQISVNGGTQEFYPSDLEVAVEFKYIKNINYLRYRPDDDNSKYRDIAADIERLGAMPDEIDRRCLVFGNYDIFRRDSDVEAEQGLMKMADENGVFLRFILPTPMV